MSKLKKMIAVTLTLVAVMSVLTVAVLATGTGYSNTLRVFYNVTLRVEGSFVYTDTIKKQGEELVKFSVTENSLSDPLLNVRVKVLGTSTNSNSKGDNLTLSDNGILVPYVCCQVEMDNAISTVKNSYSYIYVGIASDCTETTPYTVNGVWGYGTI